MTIRQLHLMLACLVSIYSHSVYAVELRSIDVHTGTTSLLSTPLVIENSSPWFIQCTAQLAHWYSSRLIALATETRGSIPLWFDPATGTIIMLNKHLENLPVEAIACTVPAHTRMPRSVLALQRSRFVDPAVRHIKCANISGRLACQ